MPIISPKIPTGLEELMRGLAKSVIKENPQNIYEFAAEYFENLLRERDGSVDQSYKKFATYKVYKKNKSARLKREKENSRDVNDNSDNGCMKDESSGSFEKRQKRDVHGVEEFIVPAASQALQSMVKAQTSVSSESEFHASIKKESSLDIEGAPSPSKSHDDEDDIANMVLDSDMEEAALKIQSTFRGHKTRKEVKSKLAFGEEINEQVEVKEDDAEIKTISESEREGEDNEIVEVLQNNEEAEGSLNENQIENKESIDKQEEIPSEVDDDVANMVLDDEMEQAALKIQSTFRGHKTRVQMKQEVSQSGSGEVAVDGSQEGQEGAPPVADDDDDVANMVLDEEMEMAALKIQSSFRGHKVRQEMKDNRAVSNAEIVDQGELNEDQQEEAEVGETTQEHEQTAGEDEVISQEVLEGQKLSNEEIIEDEIKPETVSETMASMEKEISEVETIGEGEALEECEGIPGEEILSEAPGDDDLLDTPVDGVEADVEEAKEAEQESNGIEIEENVQDSPLAEGALEEASENVAEIPDETLQKLESLEVLTTNPETDSEEAELVKEIEAALQSNEPSVDNATGSLSEAADVTIEGEAESMPPQAVDEEEVTKSGEVEEHVELVPQESLKLDDESPVEAEQESPVDESPEALEQTITEEATLDAEQIVNDEAEQTVTDEATADVADGDEIIEQSSLEKSLNEVVEQDEKSAENLSDEATGDLQSDEVEKVSGEAEEIKKSVDTDDQPALEGDGAVEGGEMMSEDENKLQKDLSTVAEAIETSPSQEATENQLESEDVIELTEKSEINIDERVGEEEKVSELSVEQPQDESTAPVGSSENNEQEPQSTLNELPNEIETEADAVDPDYIDSTPVVEEVCEKKFIGDLVDDQVLESEIAEKEGSMGGSDRENKGDGSVENLVKVPSGEIEYSPLKESLSEHDVTPTQSLDEVDDKSRDLTDEKSLDADSKSSKQPSVDENCSEMRVDEASLVTEKSIESLIRSSTVDDAEAIATRDAEAVGENLNEAKAVDSILNAEISPIELMDEVINERAGAVANELFNVEHLSDEAELEKSPEGNQSTEIIEPKLSEENPLKEIEPSKSINLSQESFQQLQDEQNPINDEILQPDIDDSEIPEETHVPVDENIPTVSLEAENPSVADVEQLPGDSTKDEDREPQKNDDEDDDIANMVLDDEMEDAALKIQAAFRGHKVRKDVAPPTSVQETETEAEENGAETNVVIDQCTDEGQTDEQQEEAEAQDTSIDVEEIQESDEQEQAQEDTRDEEETAEEETAVDSAENETAEQTEDDPEGTPEGGEASEQQPQNDDDDDVANMVLDEEMEQAALKIQSTFRGHKTRANMKKDGSEGGETSTPDEPSKDSVQEASDDVAKLALDDKEGEKKEEEPAQSSSTEEKTAKQLQDEEDIANIVMDAEMEQTALKIQSAFRGKLGRKKPKEGSETTEYETETEEETPAKSEEEDPFGPNEMSQEHETSGEKFDDERASDYSGAAHYSQSDEARYSIDRYDGSIEYEPLVGNTSTDDINLMQGGGIFPEASGESSDLLSSKKNSAEMMTGSSGEDREPDRHSSYEKVPSDKSFEIDEAISRKKSVDQLNDEQVIIENFDFDANKDTAEAMYYALKKNEIETQRQFADKQASVEGERTEAEQRLSLETTENQSMDYEQEPESDDDDDCVVIGANSAKRLKYGMSMDDRLLGSILSQDYTTKTRRDVFPDDGFDPLLEASMRNQHFLEKLHEMSNSDEGKDMMPYDDYPGEDEDHFDDFYRSNNIRQKIMASSVSIADSDYFDPTNNKSSIIDENIRTALETIHSTDSESTTITKIQAGERLGAKRANNINTQSMQYASFGNAAIDKSLDEFIQSQELRIDRFDEEAEGGFSSPPPRMQESIDDWTDDTTTYTDSDKKVVGAGGVIGIKLEQKPSFLTVDERRRTLHREDAIQRNSTREDEDSSKSSNVSSEKLLDKENVIPVASVAPQKSVIIDGDVEIPVPDLTVKAQASSQSIAKPHRMKRQHTMPVQIQTDVIRIIPKHLRKRIKSAESTDKKKRAPK